MTTQIASPALEARVTRLEHRVQTAFTDAQQMIEDGTSLRREQRESTSADMLRNLVEEAAEDFDAALGTQKSGTHDDSDQLRRLETAVDKALYNANRRTLPVTSFLTWLFASWGHAIAFIICWATGVPLVSTGASTASTVTLASPSGGRREGSSDLRGQATGAGRPQPEVDRHSSPARPAKGLAGSGQQRSAGRSTGLDAEAAELTRVRKSL